MKSLTLLAFALAPAARSQFLPAQLLVLVPHRAVALATVAITSSSTSLVADAQIVLTGATAQMTQRDGTTWIMAKEGVIDTNASTVTWTITALSQPGGLAHHLVVDGTFTVQNAGTEGATIGNIVVNLQTKGASGWQTRSSDVADATQDDAATSAFVVAKGTSESLSQFTENTASGVLQFTDASTNTVFPLVPQVTIPAGASLTLLVSAAFDNDVLNLATGTAARAEILVSFGNAPAKGKSAANLDINGNGVIDADETHVRTVPARLGLTVPAESGSEVLLTDTLHDITTTGTVTFSDPVFDLGATSGTVSAIYDAGTDGGTITNCAHLTGTGVSLTACDKQVIGEQTCPPGASGCGWQPGDMLTFNQNQWGDLTSTGGMTLSAHYANVYQETGGLFEVGIIGFGGFSMLFDSGAAVISYLPATGPIGPLTSDLLNPTSSVSGDLGGEVVALALNVDYSDAGFLDGATNLGDLRICNFAPLPVLNGMTVRQVLAGANNLLGGGIAAFNHSEATSIASFINNAFIGGTPSAFAQDHLVNGACPCTPGAPECGWETGDMRTFIQAEWGGDTGPGATLLAAQFATVYAETFGVEVGIVGPGGFSMGFTDAWAIQIYLPALGLAGPLTADHVNPTSTASGAFGGNVLALQLNVDFSAAGFLPSVTSFGDLNLCGVPGLPNMTIEAFLGVANTLLGGGSVAGLSLADIAPLAETITAAFLDGNPSTFAQEHLVRGHCR